MSRPGRPKQHTHNWQMKVKNWHKAKVPESMKPYTNMAYGGTRYWACIRGNKVKHTDKWISYGRDFNNIPFIMEETFVLAGSGFYPEKLENVKDTYASFARAGN